MNGTQVPMVNAMSKATTISDHALLYPQILTFSWKKKHAHSHLQHAEDQIHFTIGAITAKPKNQENFHRPSIWPCLVPLPITSRHKPICWLQHSSSHLTCKLTYTQRHALHAMRRGWEGLSRRSQAERSVQGGQRWHFKEKISEDSVPPPHISQRCNKSFFPNVRESIATAAEIYDERNLHIHS